MRTPVGPLDDYFAGTIVGDGLEVSVWRGGRLVAPLVALSGWDVSWDADRQVQGMGTFVISDPDGRLAPWGMGDALAPGGSRLQVAYVTGQGARVPLGWWRIRSSEPSETWSARVTGGALRWVPGAGTVTVRADEETSTAVMERMDSEVPVGPTCIAEVRRLLSGICPVSVADAVSDAALPAGLVYDVGRMDAVDDLLGVLGAAHRMGPDGALQIVPAGGVDSGWVVAGGPSGALVSLERALSDDGVYNAAISSGETPAGVPVVGRAYLGGGPVEWGGPFGRVPLFHRAIASTSVGVAADARAILSARVASGEVDLSVRCLSHPGVQVHDRVTVRAATVAGERPIEGRVVGMAMSSASASGGVVPAREMSLRVRVSVEALEAVSEVVRRG